MMTLQQNNDTTRLSDQNVTRNDFRLFQFLYGLFTVKCNYEKDAVSFWPEFGSFGK